MNGKKSPTLFFVKLSRPGTAIQPVLDSIGTTNNLNRKRIPEQTNDRNKWVHDSQNETNSSISPSCRLYPVLNDPPPYSLLPSDHVPWEKIRRSFEHWREIMQFGGRERQLAGNSQTKEDIHRWKNKTSQKDAARDRETRWGTNS